MIPKGWIKTTIGEISDFSNGYGFRPPDWASEGLPIIRIQNLNGSKEFNYYNGVAKEEWLVEPDTILFAWAGTRGVSFGPYIWNGPRAVLNQHIYRVHPKDNINPLWLYAMLEVITRKIEQRAHGFKATLLHVRKADITGQVINLPPLPEQRKIVEILSTWDQATTLTERLITAKQCCKKALMQQLLTGRRRFREFEGEEWREVHLGEVFTERREMGFVDLPLLSVTDEKGIVYRDTLDRRDTSNEDKSKYLHVCPGDIAYNTMRMWQGRASVSKLEGIVSPAYTVCVPKTSVDVNFMGYLFKFSRMIYVFWRFSQGLVSDTLNLKFDVFAKIKVKIPGTEEQRKIAAVLQACDEEIKLLEQKLAALKRQKKGLMQKLLTGQVRMGEPSPPSPLSQPPRWI